MLVIPVTSRKQNRDSFTSAASGRKNAQAMHTRGARSNKKFRYLLILRNRGSAHVMIYRHCASPLWMHSGCSTWA
ncbi:MAG: hypothetical protein BWX71_00366 [Deltaproteobacteria bacterium ADurb.Bin072]|nr:MAG: hypothetical protein BWX71_00366 [Deltaproteobacteria bacterium ADurb.Bin072]